MPEATVTMEGERYALYGSLRKNMDFFQDYAREIIHLKTVRIRGYRMFSLGAYPYAIRSADPSDTIVCDLCVIPSGDVAAEVEKIERAAGYLVEEVVYEGTRYKLFVFANIFPGSGEVHSGDWVKYRRGQ